LQIAASNGDLVLVDLFLGAGAGIGERQAKLAGRTALQAAAGNGHIGIVGRLVGYDKSMIDAGPSESYGRTALQAAAEGGHFDVVDFLLKEGVTNPFSPGSKYYGRTVLQAAAGGGNLTILNMLLGLLDLGDVDRVDDEIMGNVAFHGGRNAIQAGAEGGHLEIVSRLLKLLEGRGTPRHRSKGSPALIDGVSALEAAAAIGHEDLCKLLLGGAEDSDDIGVRSVEQYIIRACGAAAEAGHLHTYKPLGNTISQFPISRYHAGICTLLAAAVSGGHIEIIDLSLRDITHHNPKPPSDVLRRASGGGCFFTVGRPDFV
jgi:ankyrin repeat protein